MAQLRLELPHSEKTEAHRASPCGGLKNLRTSAVKTLVLNSQRPAQGSQYFVVVSLIGPGGAEEDAESKSSTTGVQYSFI